MPRDYASQPPTAFQRRPHLTKDDDWIRAFLREAKIGHIATSENGQPFINHQIVFHSNVAGRVRSNVEANP
jgi:nitroimidazol reductase NimA-like FMN-containing flavoprotein (pyridoxamine 5'-phosphate oxidase superfamily)